MEPNDYADLLLDPVRFLNHADPAVRRLALSACIPQIDHTSVADAISGALETDDSPRVRAEAAEALGRAADRFDALQAAGNDPEPIVREAVATAFGEYADSRALAWLIAAVDGDPDRLVQEAAIAALGAIADEAALPILLRVVSSGGPQLRRRAVVALTVFDGPGVEAALRSAAQDRNPMVREAAEMVVGRPSGWEHVELTEQPD